MTKQSYYGRHRGQATPRPEGSRRLLPVESQRASSPALPGAPSPDAPQPSAPCTSGRHRARGARRSVSALAGSGMLLPTAATATILLTTTGAHLGATAAPTPVVARPAVVAQQQASLRAEQADVQQARARALSVQLRAASDRSSRAAARTASTAAAASVAARATAAARTAAATRATVAKAVAARAAATHRWVAPLDVPYALTSGFGMRWGSMHPGQDFAVPVGSPIRSMSSGTVVLAAWSGGYGNKVEIRYWDGTISWYAHNSRLTVQVGQTVAPGQVVALSGNTGHSTGPHSHMEIHLGGDDTPASAVSPVPWLLQHGNMPGRASAGASVAGD